MQRLAICITSGGLAAQTATKVHTALGESLGHPPWPDLHVLTVVAGDVDVLVPAWAAQVDELVEDHGRVAHESSRLLQDAVVAVPQAQLALVEDDLVHAGGRQHLRPGRLDVQPRWLGLLVDEIAAELDPEKC